MASVIAQVVGGSKRVVEANTLGDVREELDVSSSMAGKVNSVDQSDDYELSDGEIVTFANKPKGGQ